MEIFARLMLYGVGVTRQTVDVTLQLAIFPLQRCDLRLQIVQVMSLIAKSRQAIASKNYVVGQHQRQDTRSDGCNSATHTKHLFTHS